MYADDTLTPKEAIRLCTLGSLAQEGPLAYGILVNAVRHFIGHIIEPSLDTMGISLELLKHEGLISSTKGADNAGQVLTVTEAGQKELRLLLTSNIRFAASDLNKLIVALKFRFLHFLEPKDQIIQADLLVEDSDNELSRLSDLLAQHKNDEGYLCRWLENDIDLLNTRLVWLKAFRSSLNESASR
jgi:DNA-binding PadR family transcriptional regulator